MMSRRGQIAIFVIIALVIVAGIIVYFFARGNVSSSSIPAELSPVFNYYESCIEQEGKIAIELAGSQGGYVDTGEYVPGSEYAPFSSHLNFLGFPVPYWYYVTGNGLIKENIPMRGDIENGIADYVEERLSNCDFTRFNEQGFDIEVGEPEVRVNVEDESVGINVKSDLVVTKGVESAKRNEHNVGINSKLGKFYDLAKEIYEKQKEDAILENYAVDVLRLYSPVDGVEISCSGKVWKTREVIDDLKSGLEANIASIKFGGDYYELSNKEDEYYVVDLDKSVDENVNLIYSRNFPTKVEIYGEGVDDELMISSPVGIQEGMGIMGFCYSPYHFVYDVSFPVLVQIYNNDEVFQFPVVSVIDNNLAREGVFSELALDESVDYDLCEFNTQDVQLNVYDVNLNSINQKVDVSYQCFNQRCRLGESIGGHFEGKAPSCLNGYLLLQSEGYANSQELFSSNSEDVFDVILDREYEVKIELNVGGNLLSGDGDESAVILFVGKDGAKTVSTALPEGGNVKLSEGLYDVMVYVYGKSDITLSESKKTQCYDVPKSGVLGFFGATKKNCVDITIPESKIDYSLIGGGKGETYILESELEKGKMVLQVDGLPLPRSLEDLQYNYEAFDLMEVYLDFYG